MPSSPTASVADEDDFQDAIAEDIIPSPVISQQENSPFTFEGDKVESKDLDPTPVSPPPFVSKMQAKKNKKAADAKERSDQAAAAAAALVAAPLTESALANAATSIPPADDSTVITSPSHISPPISPSMNKTIPWGGGGQRNRRSIPVALSLAPRSNSYDSHADDDATTPTSTSSPLRALASPAATRPFKLSSPAKSKSTPSSSPFDHSLTSLTETSLGRSSSSSHPESSSDYSDSGTSPVVSTAALFSSSSPSSFPSPSFSTTPTHSRSRTTTSSSYGLSSSDAQLVRNSPQRNASSPSVPPRPYSLSSEPDTPSHTSLTERSHSNTSVLQHDEGQSISGMLRNSTLEDVSLGVSHTNGGGAYRKNEEEEARKKIRRKTVQQGSSNQGSTGEHRKSGTGGQSYDFLLQRLEAQNSQLETDPKAKRVSMRGTAQIRATFDRVHREMAHEEDLSIDWDFWGRVMGDYELVASTQPRELSRAIQKGIPSALRGMTWQLMAASKDLELETTYAQLLKETSSHEKSISRDLSRTFPGHDYFRDPRAGGGIGQENLFNVVKAYSLYDEEVGYTQGLQFIVGPLLLNMPDEEAFCVLVRLMKSYDLRSHYTPNMPGLQLRLFQFDRLCEELLPGVFMHMLRQGVKSSMYASQWFLTLFGYRFPLELVSSVFDLVFAEGVEAIFRFSVAILKRNEKVIMELEFEHLLEFLKNGLFLAYAPDPNDKNESPLYKAHEFVKEALQIKITPLMLDQFGEEWENLCRQQNAHTAEIENLRKANSQLSAQVRGLEASLSQINIEHCDLVRQVVMSKLEREELQDELVKYKVMFADLAHQQASDGALSRTS